MSIQSISDFSASVSSSSNRQTVALNMGETTAKPPSTTSTGKESLPDPAQLQSAVEATNKIVRALNNELEFSVDSSTKTTVVKVVDPESGEVIRQIPPKEMLAIAQNLQQSIAKLQGLLVRDKS